MALAGPWFLRIKADFFSSANPDGSGPYLVDPIAWPIESCDSFRGRNDSRNVVTNTQSSRTSSAYSTLFSPNLGKARSFPDLKNRNVQ